VAAAILAGGCAEFSKRTSSAVGVQSRGQAFRFVKKAIRTSSEGFVLMPSVRAERVYELARLNEISQVMRGPAAACFLNRAIETMKRVEGQDGPSYADVPEGQVKIRTRIAPDGSVMRTEVLESGFKDGGVVPCVEEVIQRQKFPQNQQGHAHYIDVIYWVSLGAYRGAGGEAEVTRLRREQAAAGVRARNCLKGRVEAGTYEIASLALADRDGRVLVNRVEPSALPADVAACVAQALRGVRIDPDPDSFVRPLAPVVAFSVAADGTIGVRDEEWHQLLMDEEAAARDAKRAELLGGSASTAGAVARTRPTEPGQVTDPASVVPASVPTVEPTSEPTPGLASQPPLPPGARPDPSQPGLKLDLRGVRRGG
jgi:hypothetical protein